MSVTVLMPLKHYHERHLAEALDSLFHQSRPDWHVLIVVEPEDAGRLTRVLAAPLSDSRVRLTVNQGRKLAGAFNSGMRQADSEFVAILLADDLWAPHAHAVLCEAIRRAPEVDFFHSGRIVVDEAGRPISTAHLPRERVAAADFAMGSAVKHLLCWRRAKALAIGGMDESLNNVGPDDWDFPWSMADHGAVFQAIPESLYWYRDHRDAYRLTTHLPRSVHLREIRRILKKHGTPPTLIAERLRRSRRSFLRQCLYRNRFDRWWKQLLGIAPRPWRESYS